MGRGHDSCISSRHLEIIDIKDHFREILESTYEISHQDTCIKLLAKRHIQASIKCTNQQI